MWNAESEEKPLKLVRSFEAISKVTTKISVGVSSMTSCETW